MMRSTLALGEPITGPGKWIRDRLDRRSQRILECLEAGTPQFETVKPPGYDHPQTRCTRCKCLKRHHELVAKGALPV